MYGAILKKLAVLVIAAGAVWAVFMGFSMLPVWTPTSKTSPFYDTDLGMGIALIVVGGLVLLTAFGRGFYWLLK
jgi:hypothetical protein